MSTPASPASPAERYAAVRSRITRDGPELTAFQQLYDFTFDDFQCRHAGPLTQVTGCFSRHRPGRARRWSASSPCIWRCRGPQVLLHHPDQGAVQPEVQRPGAQVLGRPVGLLTGDNSVNGEAPIVVMTTEVLRNMLYAGSPTLTGLGYVVLDEVHYLADRFRGAVWEEVIIHLPESVRLVALSATVSNAEEFGDWLAQVRGGTTVIVDDHRPVPLWQHMMVGSRLYDLFTKASSGMAPDLSRSARSSIRSSPRSPSGTRRRSARHPAGGHGRAGPSTVGAARPGSRRPPAAGDQPAGCRGAAAGDHVHLQPGRLRRRGPAVPGGRAAADHPRGTRRDPPLVEERTADIPRRRP